VKFFKFILIIFPILIYSQKDSLGISINNGKSIYNDFCIICHMHDGKGQKDIFPPLAKSDYLFKNMEESIKAIKFGGIDGEIVVNGVKYDTKMQRMGLYDDEIADVMNYILNSWGNKYDKMIREKYIRKIKK